MGGLGGKEEVEERFVVVVCCLWFCSYFGLEERGTRTTRLCTRKVGKARW